MPSTLREQLGRLGPVGDVDRVASGLPADVVVRPADRIADVETIAATLALAKRGPSLFRAKRTVEAMVADGTATVHLPTVESFDALTADLRTAGVVAAPMAGRSAAE